MNSLLSSKSPFITIPSTIINWVELIGCLGVVDGLYHAWTIPCRLHVEFIPIPLIRPTSSASEALSYESRRPPKLNTDGRGDKIKKGSNLRHGVPVVGCWYVAV